MEDDEADYADDADTGRFVSVRFRWRGMLSRRNGKAYVRPQLKIPVRTSFCGWLVLNRQRIGIGYK